MFNIRGYLIDFVRIDAGPVQQGTSSHASMTFRISYFTQMFHLTFLKPWLNHKCLVSLRFAILHASFKKDHSLLILIVFLLQEMQNCLCQLFHPIIVHDEMKMILHKLICAKTSIEHNYM